MGIGGRNVEFANQFVVPSQIPNEFSAVDDPVLYGDDFLERVATVAVQPMLAKMVLPKLGGSPSVWAVSMCFFQGALLLGYCYAFLLHRLASVRGTVVLHVSCWLLPVSRFPSRCRTAPPPFAGGSYLWLVAILAMAVGLPFIGMAASAPLLQSWFASTAHPDADEPYFLYRASNAGSLVALIGYPVLFEPLLAFLRKRLRGASASCF